MNKGKDDDSDSQTGTDRHETDWREWRGLAVTVVTAYGYLLGYVMSSLFTAELGAAPSDLGFALSDYLVVAGVTIGLWLVAAVMLDRASELSGRGRIMDIVGAIRQFRSNWRTSGKTLIRFSAWFLVGALGQGLAILAVALVATSFGVDVILAMLIAFVAVLVPPLYRRSALLGVLAAIVFVLTVSGIMVHSTQTYARNLVASSLDGGELPRPPIPLRLVINPQRGLALIGDNEACVVRVADRLVLEAAHTTVGDIGRFSPQSCNLDGAVSDS